MPISPQGEYRPPIFIAQIERFLQKRSVCKFIGKNQGWDFRDMSWKKKVQNTNMIELRSDHENKTSFPKLKKFELENSPKLKKFELVIFRNLRSSDL